MKRTLLLTTASLFAFSPFLFAQDSTSEPTRPNLPADIVGPQLVAWSQLQKPRPVPQPLPPPDRADQQQPGPNPESQAQQQPLSQIFIGTIVKDGGKYVLKELESSVFQLDDQEKAKLYEGKQVKIAGSLDAKNNTLHVARIELLS